MVEDLAGISKPSLAPYKDRGAPPPSSTTTEAPSFLLHNERGTCLSRRLPVRHLFWPVVRMALILHRPLNHRRWSPNPILLFFSSFLFYFCRSYQLNSSFASLCSSVFLYLTSTQFIFFFSLPFCLSVYHVNPIRLLLQLVLLSYYFSSQPNSSFPSFCPSVFLSLISTQFLLSFSLTFRHSVSHLNSSLTVWL